MTSIEISRFHEGDERNGVAVETMRVNRENLARLINEARSALDRQRPVRAVQALRSAAGLGWQHHPGYFRDARIDALTLRFADSLAMEGIAEPTAYADHHVLHVLTQAYAVGGHTRLAQRWISLDSERTHSVVLTEQAHVSVPEGLRDAVAESGGEFIVFHHDNEVDRARALRDLSRRKAGLVVLHTHPGDLIPTIALGRDHGPVVLLNHADHLMWVGLAASTVVAEIREAGRQLSISRRGVQERGSVVLPIPLIEPTPTAPGLREALGLGDDDVVLLSIAAAHKFGGPGLDDYRDVHRDLLSREPRAVLLVVGPVAEGRWADLERSTDGRFRALGIRSDIDALYAIADIYVDSTPMTSLTSLLDAALRGIPAVAFSGPTYGTILSCDDPALVTRETQSRSATEYLEQLSRLINDATLRQRAGEQIRDQVRDHHLGDGWRRHLERVYDAAITAPTARPQASERALGFSGGRTPDVVDIIAARLQGPPGPLASWRLRYGPRVDTMSRILLVTRAVRAGDISAVRHVLPQSVRRLVAAIRRGWQRVATRQ